MANDRPVKSGSRHFEREEDYDLSTPALVELAQLVLGKGRTIRLLAKGISMTPFIRGQIPVTQLLIPDARAGG
jgi:hypothetical protein